MKILYFGSACDKEWFDKVSKIKAMPYGVAQYRFETALLDGLASIDDLDMEIFYLYQESYYPKGRFLTYKSKVRKLNSKHFVNHLPGINLPIFKEIFWLFVGFFLTLKFAFTNRHQNDKLILTPFNYAPLSLGIFLGSKLFGIKRANVFTDLSSDIMNDKRQKDMIRLKRVLLPYYQKIVSSLENNYDYYILFTEAMNERVNPKHKPYLVMEGIFNADLDLSKTIKEKAIMYAGTLSFEYGIKMFLDAFEQIKDEDLQLWLFGDGDMREYIHELSERDNRVIYFGFKSHEEVFDYEKKATLLINTRNPEDSYTKYSFPSKTFEYMVSGTPYLTTRIAGIPEEYYQYLYVVEDYSVLVVKQKIEEVLDKPQCELDDFGQKARLFVLENKNSKIQAKKIIDMIK
jgi:glycosyltransferase involved in cell wall biosynthesis